MNLKPLVVEPVSLGDRAADVLRRAIMAGQLPPGSRLVEEEIAAQLGVSRMPVRQAIQQLADEGLVNKVPGKGAFVQQYSSKDLDELYSLRIVLEQFALSLFMDSGQRSSIQPLHAIVDRMADAARKGDRRALFELDSEFHSTLVTLSGHSLLEEVLNTIRSRISSRLLQGIYARSDEELAAHVEKHRALVHIIEQGDYEAAKEELRAHLLGGKQLILADAGS